MVGPMRQVTIVVAFAVGLQALQASELDTVLRIAADYIFTYEREITAVSGEEDYVQRVPTFQSVQPGFSGSAESFRLRRLRSNLVLIAESTTGWVEFRDVFEVDGRPVRDRDERLVRLFATASSDQHGQAARIVEESARFNLNPPNVRLHRTLNVPMTALRFLRAANQSRSTFELRGKERHNGRSVVVVRFREQAMPRLIGSNEASAAKGSFWIDEQTGAVIRSELELIHQRVAAKLTVEYAEHPTIKLWLPASMEEVYTITSGGSATIFGKASYTNFKRFKVETSATVK